ncbi:hypothetical protein BT69DRAFT_1272011 [Atractiella rhizophila]|nr:hypothetical protein BT69DRAFT_1272011 [Atractiella rhizophila]
MDNVTEPLTLPLAEGLRSIEDTNPSDWDYIAEGGANIVVAYVGSLPQYRHKALRLPKFTSTAHSTDTNYQFTQLVISPLLGPEFLPTMDKVTISSTFVQEIYDHIEAVRPGFRKEGKEEEVVDPLEVFLVENLVGNAWDEDALAVEIKPKWGFLPALTHLSEDSKDVKGKYCRFCMHLVHKSKKKEGEEDDTSERLFCPLDLYSKEEERVKKAAQGLWDDWITSDGKHNNLRLFLNGRRLEPNTVFTDENAISFFELSEPTNDNIRDAFCLHLSKALMDSHVLRRLKFLQRTLDSIDIEGLSSFYLSRTNTPLSASSIPSPTLEEWKTFVHNFTDPQWVERVEDGQVTLRELTLAYILSATFKDCSLFVRLEKPKGGLIKDIVPEVRVIDLDQKDIGRIKKYEKLDRDIVEDFKAWLAAGGKKKECQ